MNFGEAIKSGFSKYATFSGRAARSEFWYWTLFVTLAGIALSLIDVYILNQPDLQPLNSIFSLGTLLPGISVLVRRLHDVNRSGWWFWLVLIPIIGWIVLLVWECTKGTDGENDYGTDPLNPHRSADVFS